MKAPWKLKEVCYVRSVWSSNFGGNLEGILHAIIDTGGIPTTWAPTNNLPLFLTEVKLPLDDFKWRINDKNFDGHQFSCLLYVYGPIIGVFWADRKEYSLCTGDRVYRGCPKELRVRGAGENHAVVCFAYQFDVGKEEKVRIIDNHSQEGPIRWIAFSTFDMFFIPIIKQPIDIGKLRSKKKSAGLIANALHGLTTLTWKITLWLVNLEVRRYD